MDRRNARVITLIVVVSCVMMTSLTSVYAGTGIQAKTDEYVHAWMEINRFSGAILLARDGEILVNKGYGMANYEHGIPNTSQTKFRIGSLTKSFTAAAIMMLQEQGKLSVNDPLSKYIPDYPNGDKIQLVHLLTHTSGIPDHTKLPGFYKDRRVYPFKLTETIARFKNLPLEFAPGEKFSYSSSGYILLGYIIEQVTGMPYGDYLDRHIFTPLGMEGSGFEHADQVIPGMASGYDYRDDMVVKAAYRNITNAHASGALYSTTEDLYRWDRALYTDKILSKGSLERMFTPYMDHYGYGWGIVDLFGRKMVAHNGDTEGFRSNISRFPKDNVCIIILSNQEQAEVGRMSADLAAMLFGEDYTVPGVKKSITVAPDILDDYVGVYELQPNLFLTISREDGRMYVQPTGQPRLEMFAETETDFFLKEVEVNISFVRDDSGAVNSLVFQQGGHQLTATRTR